MATTKAAAAETKASTKKPAASKAKAATTKAASTTKAAAPKPVRRPPRAAASRAAPTPATNGKTAPTRGRKRASEDDVEVAPTKAAKKSKSDSPATTDDEAESSLSEPEEAPKPKANGVKKTASKTKAEPAPKKAPVPRKARVVGPTLNGVPIIPEHPRPAYQMLIFGNGDSSQFGMGPDATGEYPRPRMQKFFKTASDEGKLGGEDAGIESIAAGGLHTLAVDEAGKVCLIAILCSLNS
jgi:regulator of chromosome condensation